MGGEKWYVSPIDNSIRGSPPHGRGKVRWISIAVACAGITPAWAGKRGFLVLCHDIAQDHPRMGGEKMVLQVHFLLVRGSPPHGRGKVRWISIAAACAGITPAWAGKSAGNLQICCRIRDHPRMGGEKFLFHCVFLSVLGSPPHGRGKVSVSCVYVTTIGITPAWAGKSSLPLTRESSYRDHPRMGGEKLAVEDTNHNYQGSPPHGRGKGIFYVLVSEELRITPAWAGKSSHETLEVVPKEDHPRMGGEKTKKIP